MSFCHNSEIISCYASVMVDCSRSAVPTLDTIFMLLRTCALFGLNSLQLYTEDTYQVRIPALCISREQPWAIRLLMSPFLAT